MTHDEIAAMQADALAGTPGEWRVCIYDASDWLLTGWPSIVADEAQDCGIVHWNGFIQEYWRACNGNEKQIHANARRIARLPRVEAAVTALTAELAAERQARDQYMAAFASGAEQAEADQIKIEAQAVEIERLWDALKHISDPTLLASRGDPTVLRDYAHTALVQP